MFEVTNVIRYHMPYEYLSQRLYSDILLISTQRFTVSTMIKGHYNRRLDLSRVSLNYITQFKDKTYYWSGNWGSSDKWSNVSRVIFEYVDFSKAQACRSNITEDYMTNKLFSAGFCSVVLVSMDKRFAVDIVIGNYTSNE